MSIYYYNYTEQIQPEGEKFMKKKVLIIVITLILVAAVAVAVAIILGGGSKGPVKIDSVRYHDSGERAIASYIYFTNSDSKEIDEVGFSIQLYAGKELIKQFNHTHDGNIDAGSFSAESVWRDYFSSSKYTYSDITKVNIAITSYKFVGEDRVAIEKPAWKSF